MTNTLTRSATSTEMITIALAEGDIQVPAEAVMRFAEPLWGFPGRRDYALVPAARQGIWWLMSVGIEPVSFVLADPFVIDPSYVVDLGDADRATLGLESPDDALALVMLTLPASPQETMTANLRAPIVFNVSRRLAAQVVSRDEAHTLKYPVTISAYPPVDDGTDAS